MFAQRLLCAVSLALLAGCGKGREASGPPVAVKVNDLMREYDANLVEADSKYLGKTIEIHEVAGFVENDADGYFFGLAPAHRHLNKPSLNENAFLPGIIVRIDPGATKDFAKIDAMKPAMTIRGRCCGAKPSPGTQPSFFVLIENATVVKSD